MTKILLVDNDPHAQIIIHRLFKKNGFENLVIVGSGKEAIEHVQKEKFALLLISTRMSEMNGFEVIKIIRTISSYEDIPIITLCAFAVESNREESTKIGATDFVVKPINEKEFIYKVNYYLGDKDLIEKVRSLSKIP